MKIIVALSLVLLFAVSASATVVFENKTGTYTDTIQMGPVTCHTVQVNFVNYSGVLRRDFSADNGANYVVYDNISAVKLNGSYLLHGIANSAPTNMRLRAIPHYKGTRRRGTVSTYINAN